MQGQEGRGAAAGGAIGTAILGIRNDALADRTDADNLYTAIAVDAKGRLLTTAAGNPGGGSVAVAGSATLANVSGSASNVTLSAANADRIGVLVQNDSTATLYLKYGETASATSYSVKMEPGSYWEMPQPIYIGIVDGIWSAANGAARITELEV